MSKQLTGIDDQRTTFVESLYTSLKRQAAKAVTDHQKFITLASTYLTDGLEEDECVELLMIDGITRDTAESYIAMAANNSSDDSTDGQFDYSFRFEDVYGSVYSSFDINKTVKASTEDEAWTKAESLIAEEDSVESSKVISVRRF